MSVSANNQKKSGVVKWFSDSKGYGFIARENEKDVFVHFRSIVGEGHRTLHEGQNVCFELTEGHKGLQAENVTVHADNVHNSV